jgi:hypothetical protein
MSAIYNARRKKETKTGNDKHGAARAFRAGARNAGHWACFAHFAAEILPSVYPGRIACLSFEIRPSL